MTPNDVRDRFAPGAVGTWRLEMNAEPVLTWAVSSNVRAPSLRQATFEFHEGLLVATRLELMSSDADAHGPPLEVSPSAILSRQAMPDGITRVFLVARDCPTHAEEVRRLLRP